MSGLGVARKAVAPPHQLAVELVQQIIGQQRGQWPALRRAHLAGLYVLPAARKRCFLAVRKRAETMR